MFRWMLVLLALGVYAFSVGCGLQAVGLLAPVAGDEPRAGVRATAPAGLPYRGVVLQIQRTDWIEKYERCIDEIAELGADTVKLVVDARQENGASARIYLDLRMTPTVDQLAKLIRHAKDRGLRVILMPIVLLDNPRGNEWRGRIQPSENSGGWPEWWRSYREMLTHFAWIAQGNGVDVFVVGSELISTHGETHLPEWRRTISEVRRVFQGPLTYSSNWDHYTHVKFWDQLDFIGMNSYWSLGSDRNVTVPQIVARWREIQSELFRFQQKVNKPILLLEVGWCSMANMASEPWDYTQDEDAAPTDLELQKKLYEGFFQAWHGRRELGGFCIWVWDPVGFGPSDRGYTPKGKPAEQVLRDWLAKEWN
ncbi:MAG: hypothetical protein NZ561_03745 [Phycisphaerae bacterium]|nr:hypothetical protein [Phycisphaerae bacterium]MDW8261576.1 hypothetical protein [Phycisphaerales bacterium]